MTVNLHLIMKSFPPRIIRSLVRHVKYLLGLRFQVSGWEHLQTEGPYVIISNHQSSLDVLGGYCTADKPRVSRVFCGQRY